MTPDTYVRYDPISNRQTAGNNGAHISTMSSPRKTMDRNLTEIIAANCLGHLMIWSDMLLSAGGSLGFSIQLLTDPHHIVDYSPESSHFSARDTVLIIVANLILQLAMVVAACRACSTVAGRQLSIITEVWRRLTFFGLPLLVVGLLYRVMRVIYDFGGDWVIIPFVFGWATYCYAKALLACRRMLCRRATGMVPR